LSSLHESNGRVDTPSSETIVKEETPSASRVRSTNFLAVSEQSREDSTGRPKKFQTGAMVNVPFHYFGGNAGVIVGEEWGYNHRDFRREIWLYYVRPVTEYSRSYLVPENEIELMVPEKGILVLHYSQTMRLPKEGSISIVDVLGTKWPVRILNVDQEKRDAGFMFLRLK